jgi:hypothetical protein
VWGFFLKEKGVRTTEQRRMCMWSSWMRISARISTGRSSKLSWGVITSRRFLVIQIPVIIPPFGSSRSKNEKKMNNYILVQYSNAGDHVTTSITRIMTRVSFLLQWCLCATGTRQTVMLLMHGVDRQEYVDRTTMAAIVLSKTKKFCIL